MSPWCTDILLISPTKIDQEKNMWVQFKKIILILVVTFMIVVISVP